MNNIERQYQQLLGDILENGVEKKDRTGTGTLSVFGRQIRHKMSEGFPLLTTKKMAWKTMVTELLWFLRGDTNIKFLLDYDCHIWDADAYKNYTNNFLGYEDVPSKEEFIKEIKTNSEFANKWGDLGPIYGKQWRSWNGRKTDGFVEYESNGYNENIKGIDQIQNLINELKTNPDSRRLMVSAWNVGELDQMILPPCHYGFQVYTRELQVWERLVLVSKTYKDFSPFDFEISTEISHSEIDKLYPVPSRAISLMWNQRSVDTFLGLPFNIASYGLLLEIIAKSVNMVPDELIGNLGDTHLYSNHIEQAKEQIDREPFKLPKLNINTEFWPTEGGECGIGLIDANSVFEGFKNEHFCKCLLEDDIQLYGYQSHPAIKAPLSN